MKPAINFCIYTEDSTLSGDISLYCPSEEDERTYHKGYELFAHKCQDGRYCVHGNIPCKNKEDVEIILGNIIQLCIHNDSKITHNSFIGLCNWTHDQSPHKECTLDIRWGK